MQYLTSFLVAFECCGWCGGGCVVVVVVVGGGGGGGAGILAFPPLTLACWPSVVSFMLTASKLSLPFISTGGFNREF